MALQSSGPISLSDMQTEFGGSNPISLSEYYGAAAGIPASGTISLDDFYGTSSFSATGGTVTTAGGYTIHSFTSSGTFSVTGSRSVEYIVIAGGGGGGGTYAGGGGAGGYFREHACGSERDSGRSGRGCRSPRDR